jgi:hypothetical protein
MKTSLHETEVKKDEEKNIGNIGMHVDDCLDDDID